jgi:hypothetical protein
VRVVQNGHLKSKLLIKALVDPVVLRNITHKNTPVLQYMTVSGEVDTQLLWSLLRSACTNLVRTGTVRTGLRS